MLPLLEKEAKERQRKSGGDKKSKEYRRKSVSQKIDIPIETHRVTEQAAKIVRTCGNSATSKNQEAKFCLLIKHRVVINISKKVDAKRKRDLFKSSIGGDRLTKQLTRRQFSCPECGESMLRVPGDQEQTFYRCSCCGGKFWPQVENPYAGLTDVVDQELHRGERKGGSNNKGRYNKKKTASRQRDSIHLHY